VIVVYKVDRLTRSLADFAKLVELFDANEVSFVSVTQSFNTTSSMGRLTLNVLLSFAQFEREVTGERIRDKIAASKKKGIWMGGIVPFGYKVENRKLLVDDVEAHNVRLIFELYCQLKSTPALVRELESRNFKSRIRRLTSGRDVGGNLFTTGQLSHILGNRVYLGEINHWIKVIRVSMPRSLVMICSIWFKKRGNRVQAIDVKAMRNLGHCLPDCFMTTKAIACHPPMCKSAR
jgi:site-specific DNA recombinase